MIDWPALLQNYGWWFALGVVVLLERKAIISAIEKILAPIVPAYADRIKRREELAQRQQDAQSHERLDAILMLKDLILQYRNELDDAKNERHRAENETISVVRGYERLSAQVVEVLRDIAAAIQANTSRMDRLQEGLDDRHTTKIGND